MKCKSTNLNKYKKSLFEKIADFIDKITGGVDEKDCLTDAQGDYVMKNFNRVWWLKRIRGKSYFN